MGNLICPFLDTNECNYLVLLVIVYIQWLYNSFGTGSIGRCVALDSTSSGPCMWLTMGCHTCGWGRMVYCVSWCLHAFLICSICLKKSLFSYLLLCFFCVSLSWFFFLLVSSCRWNFDIMHLCWSKLLSTLKDW